MTVNVVIAGAGMSGLAAAIAAAEKGARVSVLEKRKTPGGAAAISAGAIWAPTSISRLREYVPEGDPVLQEILVSRLPGDLAWLASHGLMLSAPESVAGLGEGRNMLGGESGRHDRFMRAMADRAARLGVQFCYQAGLREARLSSPGFEIHTDAGATISTGSLILATGGFQGNRRLLTQYLGAERADHLYLRGLAESTGDGLAAALSLGARTAGDMAAFYGHTMPDGEIPAEQLQPVTPYFARYCVLVNLRGRRFVDEAAALLEEVNPQEGCRQPGGRYFLVFDQHIYASYGINQQVTSAIPAIDRLALARKLGVPVYEAETLAKLARQLGVEGVPADRFIHEIETYNEACRSGSGAGLSPSRIRYAIPVEKPPLYAMRCVPGITCTTGGISVDGRGRVLDRGKRPIRGLFAAGADAGGVFGRHYAGFLGWALVSGRLCGDTAAADS
ncbi:MAG: FAD-binding protein [Betaproteobacteria bacterium]|nr:FAD-binding protein [Betaproteobacteria bacterium]